MRTYKYRLYPTKTQESVLNKTFDMCRFTYNKLLEMLNNEEKVDRGLVQHEIINLKNKYPELKTVYSKTLQYECYRLFSNLKGLSQLKKNNRKVGRLRFKGKDWFKTIIYNQSGYKYKLINKRFDILKISKIGDIKIRVHRKFEGTIKGVIIKKKLLGWYAHIITDEKYKPKSGQDKIGIDLGIINFLATDKGVKIDNPLFMNKNINRLKVTSRRISKSKKGSKNRYKYRLKLQKIWERIGNQKNDFFHKVTTNIIRKNKLICVEDLNIKNMTRKKRFYNMRNILDSSWGKFILMLQFKAESAGSEVIKINPRNTTKKCSRCGNIQNMPLTKRLYDCSGCGLFLDRDVNAAKNILSQGLAFVENTANTPILEQVVSVKQEATTSIY